MCSYQKVDLASNETVIYAHFSDVYGMVYKYLFILCLAT